MMSDAEHEARAEGLPLYRTKRMRTERMKWDERGRTLTWDEEEAREEAEAQAARDVKGKIEHIKQLEKERQRLLELLEQNTCELERAG
jgi:hypothetical protein